MNSSSGDLAEYFILNRPSNIPKKDCEDDSSPLAPINNPDAMHKISHGKKMIHSQHGNISRATQSPSYSDLSHVSSRSLFHITSMISPHFSDSGYSTPSSSVSPSYSSLSRAKSQCNYKKYGDYIVEENLRVDPSLNRRSTTGRSTTWFFLLELLIDPTKKSVIAWTGNGMEFRHVFEIFDNNVLTSLWNRGNNMTKKTTWETLKRNIRTSYQKDIIRPTKAKNNMYAFIIEPSVYVGMTPKLLRIYIALNNINGPLTIGSPITFALPARTFARGNKLQINRPIPLREDGSPTVKYSPEYITITLFEEDIQSMNENHKVNNGPSKSHNIQRSPIDFSLLNSPFNSCRPASTAHHDHSENRYRPY